MRLRDLTIYAKEKYHIAEQSGFTIVLASDLPAAQTEYHASAIPFSKPESSLQPATMPEKIRKIIKLYRYGDSSFRQKCRNFYVQAKFMEDYEDDAPWNANFIDILHPITI